MLLVAVVTLQAGFSQTPQPTKRQVAVRKKVKSLANQARISVFEAGGAEEFGNFVSSDDDSFVFYDVDRHATVRLQYTEVMKVKDGYGGYNSVTGRHTDHRKAVVITVVVIGALGALIAAAAVAK